MIDIKLFPEEGSVLIDAHADYFSYFPTEIFFKIIYYLTPIDLLILRLTSKKYRCLIGQYAYKSRLLSHLKNCKKCLEEAYSPDSKLIFIFSSHSVILRKKVRHFIQFIEFSVSISSRDSSNFKVILPSTKIEKSEIFDITYSIPKTFFYRYKQLTGHRLTHIKIKFIFQFLNLLLDLYTMSFYKFVDLFQ